MFYLPTKEECDEIVKNSKQFFKKELTFLNKEISIYHYKQSNFEEFKKFNAFELRGLTFVDNKRFISIHKFFELNQAPGWMEDDLKDKKILKVVEKIDGSLLQPILIDNKIYFKTKLNFDTYQAKKANKLLNKTYKEYISNLFSKGKIPFFEFISPKTQVVMDYKKEALINIQVRDLKTGEYDLNFEKEAKKYNILTPKTYKFSNLKEIIKSAKENELIEGFVVIFDNMQFVKIKTDEYLKRHKILGKIQTNHIIHSLIDKNNVYEKYLNKESEKYQFFNEVKAKFLKKYSLLKKETQKAIKLTKRKFKEKYKNHPYYELFAFCKNNGIEHFDEWIKKHTTKLKNAEKFLK